MQSKRKTKTPQQPRIMIEVERKANNAPRRKPRSNRKRKSRNNTRNSNKLLNSAISTCALKYAACLANPFTGPMGCVPTFPGLSTRKMRCFCRGYMVTGTMNYGFVAADPLSCVTNDQDTIAFTAATYTGNSIELSHPMVPTVGVAFASTNSDFSFAEFDDPGGASARVVGFGIRMKYVGTELNLGGSYFSLQQPNHQSIQNYNINDFGEYNECKKADVQRGQWITLLYKPSLTSELNLSSANNFPSISFTSGTYSFLNSFYMGVLVISALPAQPFMWEIFGVYEISGGLVRGKSPSEVDYHGFSKVTSHTAASDFDHNGGHKSEGLMARLESSLERTGERLLGRAGESLLHYAEEGIENIL